MRYTPAVVLSTLAVGQAAALHNRHASFHERRQAEVKRDIADVDWSKVAYDLSGVNWSTVKYNLPGQSTPTPAPQPSAAAPQPYSQAAPAPAATSPAAVHAQSTSNTNGGLVTSFLQGFDALAGKLQVKAGLNSQSNNGGIWIGSDSQWKTTFQNQGSDPTVLVCWGPGTDTGMFPMTNAPQVTVVLGPGQSVVLSYAGGVGTACSQIRSSTTLKTGIGYVDDTWYEVTFPGAGGTGAFDISRNPNMNGRSIVAKGSMCQSDLNTCVFKCTGDVQSCTTGYDLFNCSAGNGGGGGYDPKEKGTGGGCSMSQSSENIIVGLY